MFWKKKKEPQVIRCSKASEYAKLQAIQPPELCFEDGTRRMFFVNWNGGLCIDVTRNTHLSPEQALKLAEWIKDVFEGRENV